MATSRLLSLIEIVEGGPRADEVNLGENTKMLKMNIQNTNDRNAIKMLLKNKNI